MDPVLLAGAVRLEGGGGEEEVGEVKEVRGPLGVDTDTISITSDCSWACWDGAGDSVSSKSSSVLSVLRPEKVKCSKVIQLISSSVNYISE